MKKSYPLFIFILFLGISINAQENKILDSLYSDYFKETRELPFLHLNKTSFLKGEEIWFQAYVVEQNSNKLHPTTSNLYISIFDELGALKKQDLIKITNGIGRGNFLVDSSFTKNRYFIKASTNWMKNFNEDNSYQQEIRIIQSNTKQNTTVILKEEETYEFKLFPEGGHLIANSLNNIGILFKDINNKGIKIDKGEIKTEDGEILGNFTTNNLGFGSKQLFITEDEILVFEATLDNGVLVKATTNVPKNIGITILTEDIEDAFTIDIATNTASLEALEGKKYKILVHNTKKYKNHFFFFFDETTTYSLLMTKKELFKGINIITVFNENDTPVLERIIFNDFEYDINNSVEINKINSKNDSTTISIANKFNEKIYVSASFLPTITKAYRPKNNIKSTLLLKPYVKGFIEKPQSYFHNNKNSAKSLNLLLLTQGWSKYSWDAIFNIPQKTDFAFETGIDINLKVNQKIRKSQFVLLYSTENDLVRVIPSNMDSISIKNSFIKKNTTIDFALRSGKDLFKITPSLTYSNSSLVENIDINKFPTFKNIELEVSNFKDLPASVEVLDAIEIKGNKIKYDNKGFGGETMLTSFKMENLIISPGELILDFLRSKRFDIPFNPPNGLIFIGRRGMANRENSSNDGVPENSIVRQMRNVRVYLDGTEITASLWMLENIYLNMVKEVKFGRDPGQFAEVIYIDTLSPSEYTTKYAEFSKVKTPVGFATNKEYYTPKYPSYFDETYTDFGALHWESLITIEPNTDVKIKVPKNYQEEFRVFIEGISESGKLLSINNIITN